MGSIWTTTSLVSTLAQAVVKELALNVFTCLDIDEISPNEDEVVAQAALHKVSTKKRKAHTLENGEWKAFIISAILVYLFYTIMLDDDDDKHINSVWVKATLILHF